MSDINTFITDNFVVIVVIGIITVMTIIGYIAKKLGFGGKIDKSANNTEDQNIEVLNEELDDNIKNSNTENVDVLDTIAPNFNDGGLIIGDVNENPAITNQELGISEDLYAPFGDDQSQNSEHVVEDLKIEEVSLDDDFSIVEKDKKQDEDDASATTEDLSVPLDLNPTDLSIDDIKIEDIEELEPKNENTIIEDNISKELPDAVSEEISNLVDNTFVINDATEDFEEPKTETKVEKKEPSKIEQFDVGESELSKEEPTDFEIETTTTLKLDEIDEKIKSLKLEDLDNPNFDEDILNDIKPKKKGKNVNIKSVDDIKKSSQKKNKNKVDTTDIVTDLPLPSLDEVAQDNKKIEETDDIWKF